MKDTAFQSETMLSMQKFYRELSISMDLHLKIQLTTEINFLKTTKHGAAPGQIEKRGARIL